MSLNFDGDRHALLMGAIAAVLDQARDGWLIPDVQIVVDDDGDYMNQQRITFHDGETFLLHLEQEQLPIG